MQIYLIRHGKTSEDLAGMRQSYHAPLHEDSINFLKERQDFKDIKFNQVYASPQLRTQHTAKILFPEYKIETLDFIYEFVSPKLLEGKTQQEGNKFWVKYKPERYDPNWTFDGSESFNDITARVNLLIKYLAKHNKANDAVAIVGHGTFFKHLIGVLLAGRKYQPNIFFDFFLFFQINNGACIKLNYDIKSKQGYVVSFGS
jgi:broad specificity phosphatase PhoE